MRQQSDRRLRLRRHNTSYYLGWFGFINWETYYIWYFGLGVNYRLSDKLRDIVTLFQWLLIVDPNMSSFMGLIYALKAHRGSNPTGQVMGHSWSPLRKLSEWPQASGPGPQDTSGRRPWHPHRAHDTSPPARRSWSRICLGSLDLDGDGTNAGDSIESAGRAHSQPRGFHLQRRKAGIPAGLPDWEGTQVCKLQC